MASNSKGWIIPPEVSDRRKCIKIYIPNDTYDRGAFWGALFELTYSWNWKAGGDTPPQEMANMWAEIWRDAYDRSNSVNCCDEQQILHRFDPETGRPQVSYNGGVTWVDDPQDLQNSIPLYPPLVTETSGRTKCDAATNASEHINELIDSTKTNLETAATIFALAQAIAEAALAVFIVIVSGGTLSPIVAALMAAIWAAAQEVFALGVEGYDAYWTTDKKDEILCALYCNIGDNGQFTEEQYQAFRTRLKTNLPASPAFDIVMTTINAGGARGVSQMASYGNAAEADCSSCVCDDEVHVWLDKLDGNPATLLEPDEDGHYTVTADFNLGGFYYAVLQFASTRDDVGYIPCSNLTFLTAVPTFHQNIRCHDGADDPLSHCNAWVTLRDTAPYSVSFEVDETVGHCG